METNLWKTQNECEEEHLELPPGFRFHPTDEELITHYLSRKVLNTNFTAIAIGEADLNKSEPWDLPGNYYTILYYTILNSYLNYKPFSSFH